MNEKELAIQLHELLEAGAKKTSRLLLGAVLISGIVLGAGGMYVLGPRIAEHHYSETTIVEKPTIVQETVKHMTETVMAYTPKAVVSVTDPKTGNITQQQEQTDLDAAIGKTEFNVRLNGRQTTFTKADTERFLFDKNKLALTQTSIITIDANVEPTVIDKTKYWSVGYGITSDRNEIILLTGPLNKNKHLSWWMTTEGKLLTGATRGTIRMERGAAGLEVKF